MTAECVRLPSALIQSPDDVEQAIRDPMAPTGMGSIVNIRWRPL